MPDAVKGTRSYRSPLRAAQASSTRARVIEAAHRLFIEHGYAGTTIAMVAADAEVSAETIYSSLGGKRGLLEGVIDAAVVGPTGVPHEQQAEFTAIRSLPTARERLRAYVAACCRVLARTSAVHAVIRGAADGEAFAIALRERQLQTRLASNLDHLRANVGDALRPGLSIRDAAQRYCALSSPELHHLLTVELGWSAQRHERWLADLADTELLAD